MKPLVHTDPIVSFREDFQLAELRHASEIAAFVNSAYRGESSKAGWTTEAELLGGQRTDTDNIRAFIERQNRAGRQELWLLREGGRLVGCVCLEAKAEGLAYLGMLTIEPTLQDRGLGRKLLAFAENTARARWAAERIEMTVIRHRQELIAWYRRRGYDALPEVRPFPMGDPRFGLPKRADLEFVVLEKKL